MACFIMTGEIMGGEKYGGISPKPPLFPVIILPLTSASQNFKRIYSLLSVPDVFASTTMINDDI